MLKYAPYSYSRISTWSTCPRKFKYTYIDKLGGPVRVLALDRGNFLHCLLEHDGDIENVKKSRAFKEIKKNKIMTSDDIQECIGIYKSFKGSKIGKWINEKTQIANELSISMNKNLEIIPYGHNDTIFRGHIDKVVRDGDTLILIDYKSGKFRPDMKWDQLLYYGVAMFNSMPFDKIILMNVFIEHEKFNKEVIYRKDLKLYQKALLTNIKDIESDNKFNKNETPLCDWCEFVDICKNSN